jgi:hypothetical protein
MRYSGEALIILQEELSKIQGVALGRYAALPSDHTIHKSFLQTTPNHTLLKDHAALVKYAVLLVLAGWYHARFLIPRVKLLA